MEKGPVAPMTEGPTKPKSLGKALHEQWVGTITGAKLHQQEKDKRAKIEPPARIGKKGRKA